MTINDGLMINFINGNILENQLNSYGVYGASIFPILL